MLPATTWTHKSIGKRLLSSSAITPHLLPVKGGWRLEQDIADVFLPSVVHQISLYRNLLVWFKKNISSELSNYVDGCTGVLDVFWKPLLVVGDTL